MITKLISSDPFSLALCRTMTRYRYTIHISNWHHIDTILYNTACLYRVMIAAVVVLVYRRLGDHSNQQPFILRIFSFNAVADAFICAFYHIIITINISAIKHIRVQWSNAILLMMVLYRLSLVAAQKCRESSH